MEAFALLAFPLGKHVFSGIDGGGYTITHNSVQVFHYMEKATFCLLQARGSWTVSGTLTLPLSPSLGAQPGRHHLVNFHRWVISSAALGRGGHAARALVGGSLPGIDLGPFLPSDAGDMIEMQGFGPSLTAWHLEPLCSQGSSCLSCSSSSSPYATPSHCSCVPDR